MSVDAIAWAWSQSVTPNEKLVLLAMADRADEYCHCKPRMTRLQGYTGLDVQTIQNCIEGMCKQRVLVADQDYGLYKLSGVSCRERS